MRERFAMNNCPTFDWEALIADARINGHVDLYHCLKQYATWFQAFRGGFTAADYPPVVMAYIRELNAPTGKRGRPKTSDWAKTVYRDSYETKRLLIEITKQTDGRTVDKHGNEWPVTDKPSDLAVAEVAENMRRSEGAALDAIFPERKNKQRLKIKTRP